MATHAEIEVFSQPEIWERTIAHYPSVANLLPEHGKRVAFVGCGTSWFMSMAAASLREGMGLGESDAFTASEFPHNRSYDMVVAITRSGTTTEVIDLLKQLDRESTVVITAVPDSPVTKLAGETILLDFADEQSVLQTRYATAVLTLLRTHFGEDVSDLVQKCREVLERPLEEKLLQAEQISFLGTGWTVGLAHEAALKTRESSQFWAEAYPAMDYRHGPISIAQEGRVTWMFGEAPEGLEADVKALGAHFEKSDQDPMVHLVYAQRVAIAISQNRGLNTDNPRGLARSIVLN